ncbi:MAG: hypothetical protein Q4C75_02785 [Bergeyella zoohelcum]|nr:hypothetical protein [Bergeyella zoohelcum]
MANILTQKISNHPLFPNVSREVVVRNVNIQAEFSQIVIDAKIQYYDEEKEKDVTNALPSSIKNWIVNNQTTTTARDTKGVPVANPQYKDAPNEGEDLRTDAEKEPYLRVPSFDYFLSIITNPNAPSLINLLRMHIVADDQVKFFDKMLNLPIE